MSHRPDELRCCQHTPEQIVFAVMDPRRTLKDEVPEEYLGAYAGSVGLADRLVGAVLPELAKRAGVSCGRAQTTRTLTSATGAVVVVFICSDLQC
ncbi:hypothetical protein [Yimella lutea]|uniref:hypothetical protein n=1 Tax=Yimella lutea TaxID=587872 RepID=UPI00114FB130|nr:hypothetical protein [Yimella lutea]